MRRNWTRAQQRRYKEEQWRKDRAARVADRLLGKHFTNCKHCGKRIPNPTIDEWDKYCDDCIPF